MATYLMDLAARKQCKVLFIIHRDPLVEQTAKSLQRYGIQAGYIKAGYEHTDGSHSVVIASIQTLACRQLPEDVGLVIIDECHTTAWFDTYQKIKLHYSGGVMALSPVKFLGLTATPWRTKATTEFMGQHFDAIVCAPDLSELVKMGYLSRPRHFGWGGLADWGKLETGNDGDFSQQQAAVITLDAEFNQAVVDRFLEASPERKAICFAQSVEQSLLLARLFNDAGVVAEHLEANTPHEERREMYARLASGETRILVSVGTLTEGFDEPTISAIVLARPTKSLSLLVQMCGRGLRVSSGKQDCLLLDFCENFKRLGYVTKNHPVTLCPQFKEVNKSSTKECPKCHALVYSFLMVCPECGFEFPFIEGIDEDPPDNFLPEFGELLTDEDRLKVTYLRSQLRAGYSKGLSPDRIWQLFEKKFGHYPPNEWHLGAVFRGKNSEFHRNAYREFLYGVNLKATDFWIKFHLELEFGNPKRKYKKKNGKTFTPPPVDITRLQWWAVLGVTPLDEWSSIKNAYRQQAMRWHPDVANVDEATAKNQMQLVNWAFEQAKIARG